MPRLLSLMSNLSWGTVSKAFAKSKKMMSILSPASNAFVQLSSASSRFEVHDFFGTNPCWSSDRVSFTWMCENIVSLMKDSRILQHIEVRLIGL